MKANVEVGKVLFDAARRMGWAAVKVEMGRLPIGFGETVRYWSDVVIEDGGRLFIPSSRSAVSALTSGMEVGDGPSSVAPSGVD